MLIQVTTDSSIPQNGRLTQEVESAVRDTMQRFERQVTRVVVHLSDVDGDVRSGPDDKRCRLEVRIAGHEPITVSHYASSVEQCVSGATGKLSRSLDRVFELWSDR